MYIQPARHSLCTVKLDIVKSHTSLDIARPLSAGHCLDLRFTYQYAALICEFDIAGFVLVSFCYKGMSSVKESL